MGGDVQGTAQSQGDRLAAAEAQLAERDAQLAERDAQLAERDAQLAVLVARIEDLEERLNRNSKNSNLPPSSEGPGKDKGATRRGRLRGKSTRKQGAQPGHKGTCRRVVGPDMVDEVVAIFPPSCQGCARPLQERAQSSPLRFQQVDIVDCTRRLTEWQLHEIKCAHCGHHTRAAHDPEVIPSSAFGSQVVATVALMIGKYRLSRRNAKCVLFEHFGILALWPLTAGLGPRHGAPGECCSCAYP